MSEQLQNALCRLYSVLLYAYPREFRRVYGRPMSQVFRDQCRQAAGNPHGRAFVGFGLRIISDWVLSAAREWWFAGRTTGKRGLVAEWAGTLLIYLFATTTLVQAYVVPTGSMEGTLLVGDHILVDRTAYADPGWLGRRIVPYREIRRGDIVAFLYPEDIRQTYVKRVIGLPGDRIRLERDQVIRNGRRLIEPYTQHIAGYEDPYQANFPIAPEAFTTPRGADMFQYHVRGGEVIVPEEMLFVMGDNRDNSADSRTWGFVPRSYVVGKPLVVYWSYDAPTADLTGLTFDHIVDVAQHFFTRSRWRRTLLVPRSQQAGEEDGGTR